MLNHSINYPATLAKPANQPFKNAILSADTLLNGEPIELELLDKLEDEGIDVSAVRIRINALRELARFQQQYERMFSDISDGLNQLSEISASYAKKRLGINVEF